MAAKRCSNFALALAMRSSGSVLRKRARLIFAMKTSSGPGQGNKDPKIVNPKWRVNYRAISWSRFRLKEKVVSVTSSTADDIGILAERGGDRRGLLAEGFACGDPELGAAVAAMVARPLAVFQQVEAGLRLAGIGSATATTS